MSELDTSPKTHQGQCHCGAVRYTAYTDLTGLADCNCSRCRRLSWVLKSVPAAQFTLVSGADNLTLYRFSTEQIEHLFCATCGVESFARGKDGQGRDLVMLNVNCLEGVLVIDRSTIQHWDGAAY